MVNYDRPHFEVDITHRSKAQLLEKLMKVKPKL